MNELKETSSGSEEETFNALRRTPISELDPVYKTYFWHFYERPDVFQSWLNKHGWTEEEFTKAGNQYEHELRN